MKRYWRVGIVAVCLAGIIGCEDGNPVSGKVTAGTMDDSAASAEGIESVVRGNNRFALNAYRVLSASPGNIILSPYSISTALAMASEGARGQTASEIEAVLGVSRDDAVRRGSYAALHNGLNNPSVKHTLRTANAFWAQDAYPFLDSYTQVLRNHYAADAASVDFVGNPDRARFAINGWVEARTNGKIKDLFPSGSLNGLTRLVLTNAIYFKAGWKLRFDVSDTRNEMFYLDASRTVRVPTMRRTGDGAVFGYVEDGDVQVLEMKYEGEALSMLIILPREGRMQNVEAGLTPELIENWWASLVEQRVDVHLPRFTGQMRISLNPLLGEMGMPTAFTQSADFSGMDGTRNLLIQAVVHQAFLDVNEEGSEAAAATGVSVGPTSVPVTTTFLVNRPFLYLIQDRARGALLFLGRASDPSA